MRAGARVYEERSAFNHWSETPQGAVATRRLRATLRLLLDGQAADELVAALAGERVGIAELRSVARRAETRYTLGRAMGWWPWRRAGGDARALTAGGRLAGRAALALAFRVGLGLPVADIAEVLDTSQERVGADLLAARRAVNSSIPQACARYRATLGQLGDPAIDPDDWLELLSHLPHCRDCEAAYEAIPVLDAALAAEVGRLEAALPEALPTRRRGLTARFAPPLGVAAVAIVLVGGGLLVNELLGEGSRPVPLLADQPTESNAGWLLRHDPDGNLEAYDLETGTIRPVEVGDDARWPFPIISPSGRQLAFWNSNLGDDRYRLSVSQVGDPAVPVRTFDDGTGMSPAGWLGETSFLAISVPLGPPGESNEEYAARSARESERSELLEIDVTTGNSHVLFRGDVRSATASPDGSMVVLTKRHDSRWFAQSIELCPIGPDGLGEPIWTDDRRAMSGIVWAPDSSRIYYERLVDAEIRDVSELYQQGGFSLDRGFEQAELVSVDRHGALTTVMRPEPQQRIEVASLSPNGAHIIYRATEVGPLFEWQWRLWQMPAGGGESRRLLPDNRAQDAWKPLLWSPDNTTLLTSMDWSHYLKATDLAGSNISEHLRAWIALSVDLEPETVILELVGIQGNFVAWLPEDAFASNQVDDGIQIAGDASEPQQVTSVREGLAIVERSTVSPDGRHMILSEASLDNMTVWNIEDRRNRRLHGGVPGGVWIPGGTHVIDVVPERWDGPPNRLYLYAPASPLSSVDRFDFLRFDPAGIGNDPDQHYAGPSMSPDLSLTSFFIVEPSRNDVALWLAGFELSAQEVLRWSLPDDRLLDPPLLTLWADGQTLLVAQPDGWERGLPTRVVLTRVTVDGDEVRVEPLVTLRGQGRDRGLVLQELQLSPDGSQIAYRLRHYGELDAGSGRTDTLHVMPVSDLSRALELERGAPGDGLVWSPDSRWVVAGLRGRLALLSVDGRELTYLTPDGQRAAWPLWIGEHEVWFSLDTGGGAEIWRVRII